MKMSANEQQSVDVSLPANRRSNLDLEELNRMERPSRVFSSRHHFSLPQVLPSMEDNHRRSRESSVNGSSQRILSTGSTTSGDNTRNRSSFVNFTITDPETRQVTAAGQIPLLSPPSSSHQTLANSSGAADSLINIGSDDETPVLDFGRYTELQRRTERLFDRYNTLTHGSHSSRFSRFGRRTRLSDHPYFIRNELDNNPSNSRILNNRRVRFSTINRNLNDSPIRSQTPEQELPEVEEQEMEPEDQFEEDIVLDGEESMSSLSSNIDADSGDDLSNFSVSENQNSILDLHHQIRDFVYIPNDTPRTRVVPFIMSPIPLSPRTNSPPNITDASTLSVHNNISPHFNADSEDPMAPLIDFDSIPPNPFEYVHFNSVSRSDIVLNNSLVNRVIDLESNNMPNGPANDTDTTVTNCPTVPTIREVLRVMDSMAEDDNQLALRPPRPSLASATPRENQPRSNEDTSTVHVDEHPETYDDLNDQLTRLFECPVCFEHIIPPIFQCLLGHLICNKCVLMCENCPTCRNPFNSKRNLYMEKVGYLVKFPCRNALTGCKQQMFIPQKEIHEQACCYRHYQCFFTNCAWKGYYPELHTHMTTNHTSCILHGTEQSLDIMLPNNNQTYKWFLLAHGEYFAVIAHASLPPRRVKVQVNFIGQAVKAKQFKFVITLTQHKDRVNDDNMSQKLVYERSTLPYSEIYEMSNNNGLKKDIFSLPGDVLEPYIKKRRRRLPIVLKVHPKN